MVDNYELRNSHLVPTLWLRLFQRKGLRKYYLSPFPGADQIVVLILHYYSGSNRIGHFLLVFNFYNICGISHALLEISQQPGKIFQRGDWELIVDLINRLKQIRRQAWSCKRSFDFPIRPIGCLLVTESMCIPSNFISMRQCQTY